MSEATVDWRIKGEEVGSCNCDWACPCQFEGDPTHGDCKALIGYSVQEGHFGDVDLGGVKFAGAVSWPGPIYEGDGSVQLYIDEAATAQQRDAVIKLNGGEYGGAYFEIFASVLPHVREPVIAPISIESDRGRRVASVKIGDLASTAIEPIKSPATGDEHRVRIDLPDGFEYTQAEIANAASSSVSGEAPLDFSLENSYGQLNEFDWAPTA